MGYPLAQSIAGSPTGDRGLGARSRAACCAACPGTRGGVDVPPSAPVAAAAHSSTGYRRRHHGRASARTSVSYVSRRKRNESEETALPGGTDICRAHGWRQRLQERRWRWSCRSFRSAGRCPAARNGPGRQRRAVRAPTVDVEIDSSRVTSVPPQQGEERQVQVHRANLRRRRPGRVHASLVAPR